MSPISSKTRTGGTYRLRLPRLGRRTASTPRPGRGRRRLVRMLIGMLVLVAAFSSVPTGNARADCTSSVLNSLGLGDIKSATAPTPVRPNDGLAGMLATPPDPASIPDTAPNPFTDPTVPIQSVYGNQYGWSTYDLGCIPDPSAIADTKIANVIMGVVGGMTQLLQDIEGIATNGDVSWLQQVVSTVASSIKPMVLGGNPNFIGLLPLALLAVAVIVAWEAKDASYADVAGRLGVVLLAIVAVVCALVYPAELAKKLDSVVTSVSTTAAASTGQGVSDSALIARQADYQGWLAGEFGDPTSATATKYGPTLFDATHYSWSDMKQIAAGGADKQKSINDAKSKEFNDAAKQIKTDDPASYRAIQGEGDRVGPAWMTDLEGILMSLFVFTALLIVCIARVMMAALVIAIAFMALTGMLRGRTGTVMSIWDMFAACVLETAKQALGTAVMIAVLSALVGSKSLSGGATIFWMIVLTAVGYALLKPWHAFKSITPGLNPNKSYLAPLARMAGRGVTNYLSTRRGVHDGMEEEEEEEEGRESGSRTRMYQIHQVGHDSRTLPAIEAVPQEQQQVWRMEQIDPIDSTAPRTTGWAGVLGAPAQPTVRSLPAGESPRVTALPSGEQNTELPTRRVHELTSGPTAPTTTDEQPTPTVVVDTTTQQPETTTTETTTTQPTPGDTGGITATGSQSAPAAQEPGDVVYPSGIYVQRQFYVSPSAGTELHEEYIPLHEPVIDEHGVEHHEALLYTAGQRGQETAE